MRDALVEVLNQFGYQPAWLPQTGLVPADIYELVRGRTTRLVRRGPLHHFLPAAEKLVPVEGHSANIEHRQSTKKQRSAAMDFLKRALGYLGIAASPKLDLSFGAESGLTVAFADVTYRRIDPAALDPILQQIELHAIPREQIDRGRVHIAYEYLYAGKIQLQRADHTRFEASLAGKLDELVDVSAGVQVTLDNQTTISFAGPTQRAAFAYKAACLARNGDRWELSLRDGVRSKGDAGTETVPFLPALGVVLESEP